MTSVLASTQRPWPAVDVIFVMRIPIAIALSLLGLAACAFPLFETWNPAFRATEATPYMLGLQFAGAFVAMVLATTAHPNRHETSDGTGVSFGLVVKSAPWWATALCIAVSLGALAAILDGGGGEFSMGLESFVGRPDRVRGVLASCAAGHATALAIALSARAIRRKVA